MTDENAHSTNGTGRLLPTPCPQCDSELKTRDDALVHMVMHA